MPADDHRFDAAQIDVALVGRLLAAQFPELATLPIRPVEVQGWDNRTFRLGDELSVRLPSAAGYAPQVAKELRYLPRLASQLPLPIPAPLAEGRPGRDFPWPWSIRRWIDGEPALTAPVSASTAFAVDLAVFLQRLQQIDATDGPVPGLHSAYRGGPLTTYDAETRRATAALGDAIDGHAASALWQAALGAAWQGPPVWFHGDVAAGNLLVTGGRLSAVIDWGCAGVGDPACDLTIAWTLLSGAGRSAFRAALPADRATWMRARGWALWKALITLAGTTDPLAAGAARQVIDDLLAEYQAMISDD